MNEAVRQNQALWAELRKIHCEQPSAYYDIAGFKVGGLSLKCDCAYLRNMHQDADGWWWLDDEQLRIPQTYSIKATR